MEGGDLSCVCVSELRTRSVCSVSRGVVQWPGRGSGTPGFHVWPSSAVCGLVCAARGVVSVEFVVECCGC
jgi:hypothetical protein